MGNALSRRRLIGSAGIMAPAALLLATRGGWNTAAESLLLATPAASPEPLLATPIQRIEAPAWVLSVISFQDPYEGTLRAPASPFPDMPALRYIGLELLFENVSDQPLNVRTSDLALQDGSGYEYPPATGVSGSQRKLQSQIVTPGGRARGWVWFAVPVSAKLIELRIDIPTTQLRVPLPLAQDGVPIAVGTPSS